jgi:hypothetical protein
MSVFYHTIARLVNSLRHRFPGVIIYILSRVLECIESSVIEFA